MPSPPLEADGDGDTTANASSAPLRGAAASPASPSSSWAAPRLSHVRVAIDARAATPAPGAPAVAPTAIVLLCIT